MAPSLIAANPHTHGPDLPSAISDLRPPFPDHPLAELFPLMEPDDLAGLADNIREHGLQNPIVFYEGRILDGRNRARACQLAGIEPRTEQFPADGDPLAFVLSANLHRRHLTTSQRAMLAAKLATLAPGRGHQKKWSNSTITPSIDEAADKLSVGRSIVKEARTVLRDPAHTRAVESGKKSVHAAATEIRAAQAARTAPRDGTNFEIPRPLWPFWDRRNEVEAVRKQIANVRQVIHAACVNHDLLFGATNLPAVLENLDVASAAIGFSVLYAVCDSCNGIDFATCPVCVGRGFLNKEDLELGAEPIDTAPNGAEPAATDGQSRRDPTESH